MTMTLPERLVQSISTRTRSRRSADRKSASRNPGGTKADGTSRRGFFGGAALVGAALAVDPWGYLVRPANAYDAVCGLDAGCGDGYSVFCCTINGGKNTCPPNSFIGGWWKADNASFCGGSARYYIDCNAFRDGAWQCRCAEGTCDQRRVACNQFRYGQCSLDIPASDTGPVVCRMVSCTPPWQQFGGTCTSSSATDNRTATHSAPCLTGKPPVGSLDLVSATGNGVRLAGWAFDPDQPATSIRVTVTVDGKAAGTFTTTGSRPDVNRAYRITGNHGFDVTVPTGPGRHLVGVTAVNVGGGTGNTQLGSRIATVGASPRGHLDALRTAPDGMFRVAGWAFDPDQPATSISVAVRVDGREVARFTADGSRPDVNSVYRITGNHGFDNTVAVTPGGHTVQVYAINVGGGSGNPLVGQGSVRVGVPTGHLDGVTISGRTVFLRGWAFDPDQPATSIKVAVYRNGVLVGWYPTGGARPDVNTVYKITGQHGFSAQLTSPPGQQIFKLYAINVGPASGNPVIGSRTVTVA